MLAMCSRLDLVPDAFCAMVYNGLTPCVHMRLVLHALRGLPCMQTLGDPLALDAVPVLPWPRDLVWTGPARALFRLPFDRSADVSTRAYSVADGGVRAIVTSFPQTKRPSCVRLEGLPQCAASITCRHKLELENVYAPDAEEAQVAKLEEHEDPKEVRLLALLQSGEPVVFPSVRPDTASLAFARASV
jgi:hypothetical protein